MGIETRDVATVLKNGLLRDLEGQVFNALMDDLMQQFRAKAEPTVREAVKGLAIESVEHVRDVLAMADTLQLNIRWAPNDVEEVPVPDKHRARP